MASQPSLRVRMLSPVTHACVDAEFARGQIIHGTQSTAHLAADDPRWMLILAEEVGEAGRALLAGDRHGATDELVQVAAVALAWVEALIRDGA